MRILATICFSNLSSIFWITSLGETTRFQKKKKQIAKKSGIRLVQNFLLHNWILTKVSTQINTIQDYILLVVDFRILSFRLSLKRTLSFDYSWVQTEVSWNLKKGLKTFSSKKFLVLVDTNNFQFILISKILYILIWSYLKLVGFYKLRQVFTNKNKLSNHKRFDSDQ